MYDRAKAYFLRVWRGQQSLAETFWLWYVGIVWSTVYIGGSFLALAIHSRFKTDEPFIWYLAGVIIGTVWGNVGLWRSASRTGGIWSILVRLLQLILLVLVLFGVARSFKLI